MRTVRRLYFYAIAFISLEVVLWGLIGLARTIFSTDVVTSGVESLALALSLILVGVPVFGLHWWAAQRSARQDSEEHASGVRAVFLYGVLLALLLPIVQNGLALLNRLLLQALGLSPTQAMLGGYQTLSDNLIAMILNGVIAVYFVMVLRADWRTVESKEALGAVRRTYRYVWVIYALIMIVAAAQQLLHYALSLPTTNFVGTIDKPWLAHGLTLILIGTPLWLAAWKTVQDSLVEPAERQSNLRLGVLYLFSLSGVAAVLSSAGIVIDALLRRTLGESMLPDELMYQIRGPLSIGIPLGGAWAYYGHWLSRDLASVADAPRRAGLRRLYYYILSLLGLGATFIGVTMLLSFVIDIGLAQGLWGETLRTRLAAALATLLAGLPLWIMAWRPMQAEALAAGDEGDHARRSVVRKAYLYLALFGGVIGGMTFTVRLVFLLLNTLLGERPADFANELSDLLQYFILFALLLVYHWQVLRKDGLQAAHALAARHALFPVLLVDAGDGSFARTIAEAVQKQTPRLPLVIQPITDGLSEEVRATVKAVVLPAHLALNPPEALRLWLREFEGSKIAIPAEAPGWVWSGGAPRSPAALAQQVALAIRQLAEGQEVRPPAAASAWMIVAYIFAALFGLQLLFFLLAFFVSTIVD